MITKEVLDAVGQMAVAAAAPPLQNVAAGIPYVYLPTGVEPRSMEAYLPAPIRFRGSFITRRASDFAAYIATNHVEDEDPTVPDTRIFVDPDTMSATAHFGLGDQSQPGWGDHTTALRPKMLPAYSALLANANERNATGDAAKVHTQHQILEFFRDWRENVVFYGEDDARIEFPIAIEALKSAKATANTAVESTVGNHSTRVSALEQVSREALAGGRMPTSFQFTCEPYDEIPKYHFLCNLRSDTRNGQIVFMYRIEALEARKLEIAESFVALIRNELEEVGCDRLATDARIGTFSRK